VRASGGDCVALPAICITSALLYGMLKGRTELSVQSADSTGMSTRLSAKTVSISLRGQHVPIPIIVATLLTQSTLNIKFVLILPPGYKTRTTVRDAGQTVR
jgi:hypothetical protein